MRSDSPNRAAPDSERFTPADERAFDAFADWLIEQLAECAAELERSEAAAPPATSHARATQRRVKRTAAGTIR